MRGQIFKIVTASFFLFCLTVTGYAQDYKQELQAINGYLKKINGAGFDSISIKDGELTRYYRQYYYKVKIKDLAGGELLKKEKEFKVNCVDGTNCVYNSFSERNDKQLRFSYKFEQLDTISVLFANLIEAYRGNKPVVNNNASIQAKKQDRLSREEALSNLNQYLTTFDNDRFSGIEIKDEYLYNNYKSGKYEKVKITDLGNIVLHESLKSITWGCKGRNCIYVSDNKDYRTSMYFRSGTGKDIKKLKELLDELAVALNVQNTSVSKYASNNTDAGKKQSGDSDEDYLGLAVDTPKQTTKEAATPQSQPGNNAISQNSEIKALLSKINNYLSENSVKLKSVEMKDGKVFFNFKMGLRTESQSINISDFAKQVKIEDVSIFSSKEVRMSSIDKKEIFFSSFSNQYMKFVTLSNDAEDKQIQLKKLVTDLQTSIKSRL